MTLFAFRLAQARQGEIALTAEMNDWRKRSDDDLKWHRHHSQLIRLSATVAGLLGAARTILDGVVDDAAGWRALLQFERALLAANRIWDHFRSKYLIRLHPELGRMLRLADDFAWACYAPVQDACAVGRREPPLVYFSETWSPFAMARDRSFANEMRIADMGTAEILLDEAFEQTLARLPVPLVSLPWFQASHIPSMTIIAHEIGHVVSADFKLGEALRLAIDAAEWKADTACWQRWREEVFADLFGVFVARDGFVGTLISLLATDRARIDSENGLGGIYPPRGLRMEIVLAALHRLDPASTDQLRRRWEGAYGNAARFTDHLEDIPHLLDLVMGLKCGGKNLAALFGIDQVIIDEMLQTAVNGQALGKRAFDAAAALVLAQRIDDGRLKGLTEAHKRMALATIASFVDQRETGYLSSSGPSGNAEDTGVSGNPTDLSPHDGGIGAQLWQELRDAE